jgi:hypothetical protein
MSYFGREVEITVTNLKLRINLIMTLTLLTSAVFYTQSFFPLLPFIIKLIRKKIGRLCGLVVRVPGYRAEMYCVSCEVQTEFIYVM